MARKKSAKVQRLYSEFLTAKAAKAAGEITNDEFREVSARYRHALAVERSDQISGTVATPAPIKGKAGVSAVGG